jgi:hypothetical protein
MDERQIRYIHAPILFTLLAYSTIIAPLIVLTLTLCGGSVYLALASLVSV